jgi:hypothetical protein
LKFDREENFQDVHQQGYKDFSREPGALSDDEIVGNITITTPTQFFLDMLGNQRI